MCPTLFQREDTRKVQDNVRTLFDAMTPDFRQHLMRSFMWTEQNLEKNLSRDTSLEGDDLKNAYSYLESLLARIEGCAAEKSTGEFPSYNQWVKSEFEKYESEHEEDHEDIERLMDEGGVVAPGKTSPAVTMENDSLSHYNHLKNEYDKKEVRSTEAMKLMKSPQYAELLKKADEMNRMIAKDCKANHTGSR